MCGYFLGSYSARKLNLQSTGNAGGNHNLLVSPGEQDLRGLLRQMDTGLLITELMGQGLNPVTGDYSRGAVGFWVEGGEVQYPVEEITVAGNLKQMFRDIVAIGNDLEKRGSKQVGELRASSLRAPALRGRGGVLLAFQVLQDSPDLGRRPVDFHYESALRCDLRFRHRPVGLPRCMQLCTAFAHTSIPG